MCSGIVSSVKCSQVTFVCAEAVCLFRFDASQRALGRPEHCREGGVQSLQNSGAYTARGAANTK